MDNEKCESITKRIKVYGIVQGVGFRPLVYRIAQNANVKGTVRNVGGYVEIIAQGSKESLDVFVHELTDSKHIGCEIMKLEEENIDDNEYSDFIIVNSQSSEEVSVIPPDLPVCPDCERELYTQNDRRFMNPFISCMSCGPRYTIMDELPYDRHNTTMRDFDMCGACQDEYTSPEDRRFHAQTISCNDCGPYLIFEDRTGQLQQDRSKAKQNSNLFVEQENYKNNKVHENSKLYENKKIHENNKLSQKQKIGLYKEQEAFELAISVIQKGGILAVKGIGGYHFVCSPYHEETVNNLRKLKGREEKPFAVMFPSMDEITKCCIVSEEERTLLLSNPRPIVLLYRKSDSFALSTNKASIYCGAFLPYTPLQLLLTRQCGPLIMTSANISDRPIIREDNEMLSIPSTYLDGILYNTRRIVRSVDDSVAKVIDGKPQLIRRSRGYVPYPVFIDSNYEAVNINSNAVNLFQKTSAYEKMLSGNIKDKLKYNHTIFAAGGDLKAAFCLYHHGKAVVSQYFGDLEEETVMEEYKKSYSDLSRLLKIHPSLAVCDLHPNYHSARFAKGLEIPVLAVQHHHAHIASVIAEHELKGRIIGVAFDGTGYGTDGNIWGGEFLVCEGFEFLRAAHLRYNWIIGGDQSMRDSRKTATCYLLQAGLHEYVSDERKMLIQAALNNKIHTVQNSSMGRLFDAVASILNLGQINRYEGECAALLEREAYLAIRNNVKPEKLTFAFSEENEIIEIDAKPVLEDLCRLRDKSKAGALALGFHYALVDAVSAVCGKLRLRYQSNIVALSGGVFQNTILTEQSLKILRRNNFEVYTNLSVPPNDGAISLGQTYLGLQKMKEYITK